MAKFVLTYSGGSGMPETAEEQQAVMTAWMGWFGSLGDAVVDMGNPFGASSTVSADGSAKAGAASALTGYSIVNADSLDAANSIAKSCPVLQGGGSIHVYEAMPM